LYDGKTLVGYLTCLKAESISLLFFEPHWFIVNQNLVILLEFFYIQKRCWVWWSCLPWCHGLGSNFIKFEGYEHIFGKGCVKISKNGISYPKKKVFVTCFYYGFYLLSSIWLLISKFCLHLIYPNNHLWGPFGHVWSMKLYMNRVLSNGKTLVSIDIVFTNCVKDHNFQMGSKMKTLITECECHSMIWNLVNNLYSKSLSSQEVDFFFLWERVGSWLSLILFWESCKRVELVNLHHLDASSSTENLELVAIIIWD